MKVQNVPESMVDAHADVQSVKRELAELNARHAAQARDLSRFDGVLPKVYENARRAVEELERLRAQLPATCAGVLVGELSEASEEEMLEAIAAAERIVQRCELGRPALEARVVAARRALEPIVRHIEEAEERLHNARRAVREELARAMSA